MKTGKMGNMLRLVTAEAEEVAVAVEEEAMGAGGEVTLTCADDETDVVFTVVPGETCCDDGCCG